MQENLTPENYNTFCELCLQNAKDHIKGAELLKNQNLNHLVVHLSILSLEEIGKIFMTFIKVSQREKWDKFPLKVPLDDHIKKIFFAILMPSIGKEIIDKDNWENHNLDAKKLHILRLSTLYGDLEDKVSSSQKIDNQTADTILNFAKARLHLAEVDGRKISDFEVNEDIRWLDEMSDNKEQSKFIFGRAAQDKLIELDDVNEWIKWLKKKKESENKMLIDIGVAELNRSVPNDVNDITEKWEITFTIVSHSHSIRPGDLSKVLPLDKYRIKLTVGKDNKTLIVKLTLANNIRVNDLFHFGLSMCKIFNAALNAATNEMFYWNMKLDHTKYYEKIYDLDSKKNLQLTLENKEIDWRSKNKYLSQRDIVLCSIIYEYFSTIQKKTPFYGLHQYLEGLAHLAKSDIYLDLKGTAFNCFYNAYQIFVIAHQVGATSENFTDIGFAEIEKILDESDMYVETIEIGKTMFKTGVIDKIILSEEVFRMKAICEKYILTLACRKQMGKPDLRLTHDEE